MCIEKVCKAERFFLGVLITGLFPTKCFILKWAEFTKTNKNVAQKYSIHHCLTSNFEHEHASNDTLDIVFTTGSKAHKMFSMCKYMSLKISTIQSKR